MKNKNLQQAQSELIEQLLGAVNSKEEFNYLQAEKARLFSTQIYIDVRRYA